MTMRALRPSLLLAGLAGIAASCGEAVPATPRAAAAGAAHGTALVFAAASLTAPFEQLAREFEAAHPGAQVRLSFGGTPQLVLAVREGAAVDVFASADEPNMA